MKRGASESSDATSQATTTAPSSSSPPRTPKTPNNGKRRPAYDGGGDKSSSTTSTTAHTTPVYRSPIESPSHASSTDRHSTTRFSGTLIRSYSPATNTNRSTAGAGAERNKRHGGGSGHKKKKKEEDEEWGEVDFAIDEEGEEDEDIELPGWCVAVLCGLILVFVVVCVIVWAVARSYKPTVVVKSLTVHNLYAGEGTDLTGVPTKLVTLNSSLAMSVHNPSTMFGIHVSSRSMQLKYSEIAIATGQLDKFYQPKKSLYDAAVVVHGEKTPLYGAGATFVVADDDAGGKGKKKQVALTLELEVRTRGHVIGRLVRVTHDVQVRCSVAIDTGTSRPVRFRQGDCSYKRR